MKDLLQNHNALMEKEFKDFYYESGKFEHRKLGFGEYVNFLLANNKKLVQAITTEFIQKMEEVEELKNQAITYKEWADGRDFCWNAARQAMLDKAKEMLNE